MKKVSLPFVRDCSSHVSENVEIADLYQFLDHRTPAVTIQVKRSPCSTFTDFTDAGLVSALTNNKLTFYC